MIVDLFAGPGGWDTGLGLLGRTDVLGIEWDKSACDTARAAGHERLQGDVSKIDPLVWYDESDGLIASPPCQGFSLAGKGKGRLDTQRILATVARIAEGQPIAKCLTDLRLVADDVRSALVLEPLRWALGMDPVWTCWEQVPAVLPLWEACAAILREQGFSVWTGYVQAEMYGVPQTRKRAILTASLDDAVVVPVATHSRYYNRNPSKLDEGVQKWVSMAEALSIESAVLRSNYGSGGNPAARGTRTTDEPAFTVTSKVDRNFWQYVNGNQANSARRQLSAPAPTIHFGHALNSVTWQSTAGNEGSVRVTVQEAAVLQSFPADYPWQGSKTAQFRQVGDAVPPLMAAHILQSVGAGQILSNAEAVA